MSRFLFWLLMVWLVGLIVFSCGSAQAEQMRGNKAACTDLGNLIIQAGEVRQSGVPWDQVQIRLAETIVAARSNPDSYIHNDADAAFVIKAVSRLWSDKDTPAYAIATSVYHQCMSKEV